MPVEELSTAVFNKDGIDFYNMECMFGFQVGNIFRSTLQLSCTMGLYVVTEIGHLNVPMSLEQLPAFLTSLDTLLIIANAYWSISLKSDATVEKESNKRDSLNNPQTPPIVPNEQIQHGVVIMDNLIAKNIMKNTKPHLQKQLTSSFDTKEHCVINVG
ncbi:hypothetical protein G9A89_023003 [Geosiphon pyriformis]|nr:hypothetical protein G9A89_023003 [Geosiphon pyriformis]